MGEDGPKGDVGEKVSEHAGSVVYCIICAQRETYYAATVTFTAYPLV